MALSKKNVYIMMMDTTTAKVEFEELNLGRHSSEGVK